jgi:uncharacterized protein
VKHRGRLGCDYIRNWLDFCLTAYAEISALRPTYFSNPKSYFNLSNSSAITLEK